MKRTVIGVNMVAVDEGGYAVNNFKINYLEKLWQVGAFPLLIPAMSLEEDYLAEFMAQIDGLLLVGGPDYDPAFYGEKCNPHTELPRIREQEDLDLARRALAAKMPVLGVCAGCQLLNIASGGKLIQHLPNAPQFHRGTHHRAEIVRNGCFSRIMGLQKGAEFQVNSFHHQAVNPDFVGQNFQISARAEDGTVEVIESTGNAYALGVQFHPERMDDLAPVIFGSLVAAAADYRTAR